MNVSWYILGVLCFLLLAFLAYRLYRHKYPFSQEDFEAADEAFHHLHKMLEENEDIPSIPNEHLEQLVDDIYIIHNPEKVEHHVREHFETDSPADNKLTFGHPQTIRYWPNFNYSYPYKYSTGSGAWPPGMYSRLLYNTPGFYTNGDGMWMRPGVGYVRWPRGSWVRNNTQYYFINNGKDRSKDFY